MSDARIISVNPGIKPLGELHHPRREKRGGVIHRFEKASGPAMRPSDNRPLHFDSQDLNRPGMTTLVIRLILATVSLLSAIMLSSGIVSIAAFVAGIMLAAGLFTRPTAVFCCGLSHCIAAFNSATSQFAPSMLSAVIISLLALVLLLSGPGKYSLDALLWVTTRKR